MTTPSNHSDSRQRLTKKIFRPRRFVIFSLLIMGTIFAASGCASTSSDKKGTSIFDPSGRCLFNPNGSGSCLFGSKKDKGAKELPASKEPTLSAGDGTGASCGDSPWNASTQTIPARPVGLESDSWTSQRPNGAVLFPKKLDGVGPMVTMEPRSIVAQVGSEVVMVASYVGPDNEFLRIGEKLEWNLDGTGHFLSTNPANGCLYFDSTTTKKVNDHFMTTSTSARLWRIHRGTASPTDDITILRGQSWATVQSSEEGTTSVSVFAPNIDDWNHRTSSGRIHWIDAAFRFPASRVAPLGETVDLTTTVFRKTTDEPRSGWLVRYQVLSGPEAGFGPSGEPTVEIETNADGQATVPLSQTTGTAGCNKILVQIIRPAGEGIERAVVDEKTISQVWSGNSLFNIGFQGPPRGEPGSQQHYEMLVKNLSPLPQDAVVRVTLPAGTSIASSNPPVSGYEGNQALWVLDQLPAGASQPITFELNITSGGVLTFDARVDQKGSSFTLPSGTGPTGTTAPPAPMVEIPNSPPSAGGTSEPASQPPTLDSGPAAAPGGNVSIEADMFPAAVQMNKEFNGVVRVTKTGEVPKVAISLVLPNDVYYLIKNEQTNETVNRYQWTPETPIDFHDFQFDHDYPFFFVSERVVEKTITIRVIDTETKNVLARKEVSILVNP